MMGNHDNATAEPLERASKGIDLFIDFLIEQKTMKNFFKIQTGKFNAPQNKFGSVETLKMKKKKYRIGIEIIGRLIQCHKMGSRPEGST